MIIGWNFSRIICPIPSWIGGMVPTRVHLRFKNVTTKWNNKIEIEHINMRLTSLVVEKQTLFISIHGNLGMFIGPKTEKKNPGYIFMNRFHAVRPFSWKSIFFTDCLENGLHRRQNTWQHLRDFVSFFVPKLYKKNTHWFRDTTLSKMVSFYLVNIEAKID